MLPPLEFESPTIELPWLHYNSPPAWPAFGDSGVHAISAVVHCTWRHGDAAAVVLINVDRVEHQVNVPANAETLRLAGERPYELTRIDDVDRTPLGPLSAAGSSAVVLPPRTVVILEAAPASERR
jgi:hypothetical protein